MTKRDIQQEIKSIQARHRIKSRGEYTGRLTTIEKALKELIDSKAEPSQELLKYIPIATVACIQGFFRYAIKDIIDTDKPIKRNIANFKNKIKPPDFDTIAAIQTKAFTLGELFAHSLSYNSFEDILSNLSILLDIDFIIKLQAQEPTYMQKLDILYTHPFGPTSFKENFGEIKRNIDLTFKMRNVFCHELATNVKLEKRKIIKCFYYCKLLLNQSNEVLNNLFYPDSPKDFTTVSINSHEKYLQLEKELNTIIKRIKKSKKQDAKFFDDANVGLNYFDEAHKKWKEYRELFTKCETAIIKDRTLRSIVTNTTMLSITEERINGLKSMWGNTQNNPIEFIFE